MGKTYATSRVIDWVKCSLEGSKYQEALAYFYCIEQDKTRSKATAILRSIVRQIATGPWNQRDEAIALDEAVIDIWNNHRSKDQFYDTFDEWENCLLKLLSRYPRATIVLDALDECEPSDRKQLIELFNALTSRLSNVKIFVSTRPESDLSQWLGQHSTISIHNGRTAGDIAAFVEENIAQHDEWPHMSVELKEYMLETLQMKSQGMFLCARLQMENLQDCSYEADILERLNNLPGTLTALYEKLYLRPIGRAEKIFRDRALRWVMCSVEPLTSNELLFAISQDPEADHILPTLADLSERKLLKSCNHLLLLDSSDNKDKPFADTHGGPPAPVWRLAHQAVAEFFENSACCSQERSDMHYAAGKVCLMILLDTFGGTAVEDESGWHDLDGRSNKRQCPCHRRPHVEEVFWPYYSHVEIQTPLAEYATHAWPIHVRTHEHRESHSNGRFYQMLQQFLGDPKEGSLIYAIWLEHASGTPDPPKWSVVYERRLYRSKNIMMSSISLACYLGFPETLAEWLDSASLKQHPRYIATKCPAWSPIRRSPEWLHFEQPLWWSLVALACAHDEAKVVALLLDRKPSAPTEPKDEHEDPPFVTAAIRDPAEAAQALIQRDTDFATSHGYVLRCAIYCNSLKVLRLLLKQLRRERSAVEQVFASVQIHDFVSKDSITMLLDEKIDVNTPLQDGTLLAVAVYMGCKNLVAWLLENGADVNRQFAGPELEVWEPENALEISVYAENIEYTAPIVEILIEKGASPSATAVTILCRQIDRSHPDETLRGLLRLLLCHLSYPNETCTDQRGHTTSALIEVIRLGLVDDVLLLLERGADPGLWVGGFWGDAATTVFRHALAGQRDKPKYPTRQMIDALVNGGAKFEKLEGDRQPRHSARRCRGDRFGHRGPHSPQTWRTSKFCMRATRHHSTRCRCSRIPSTGRGNYSHASAQGG